MKVVIKRDFEDIREVDIKTVRIMVPVDDRYMRKDFPFRRESEYDDFWEVDIDIETGKIKDWPEGVSEDVFIKVRDCGWFWLLDEEGYTELTLFGDAPNDVIPPKHGGGIYFQINGEGIITNWYKEFDFLEFINSDDRHYSSFAERYFFTSFENDKKDFFGETFDEIQAYPGCLHVKDRYPIVLINDKSVGIIDFQYKVREKDDFPAILNKAATFRENYIRLASHKIYLGLAISNFPADWEEICIREGIAVIKQIDNLTVVNDKHAKAF
jgi:hypothetical protein